MATQVCRTCNKDLDVESFYVHPSGNLWSRCRKCHYQVSSKAARKRYAKKNPEKIKEANKKTYKDWIGRGTPGIYLLNTPKGRYIGESKSIQRRIMDHKFSNTGIVNLKDTDVISWQILEEVEDRDKRKERERFWIQTMNPELNTRLKG